jgi:hypothetical protein
MWSPMYRWATLLSLCDGPMPCKFSIQMLNANAISIGAPVGLRDGVDR